VGAGSAGGGGSVGRPTPKPVESPPSAEPNGVSAPTLVPPDAEAEAAGGAGSGGGGGSGGPLTSNPKSPPPEASAPIVSASALPAPASEKASAAATALVIFTDVRTVDLDNKMSLYRLLFLARPPCGTVARSVLGRMSPSCPGSHQGTAGPDAGGVKPRSKGPCRITLTWLSADCGCSSTGVRDRRRAGHLAVLRLAGLVAVSGGATDVGSDLADIVGLPRRDAAGDRRSADVCVDRQREDGHR
jgi:hypothetical protein